MLFTDRGEGDVRSYFRKYSEPTFARSGFVATSKFTIPAGIIENAAFSLEPVLRKLGLQTELVEGTASFPNCP